MDNQANDERLDIVIFGASGFVGKYTVYEAASMLKELRWGVAGRNIHKLQAVLREMAEKAGEDLSQIPMIIADASNHKSLVHMAQRARVVINVVGPYRFYGENVVCACIKGGAHCVDVSGEPLYMKLIHLKYSQIARALGVYLISSCGFVSIAADMGTLFAERNFGGVVNSVETFMINGVKKSNVKTGRTGFNYGSWASTVYSLSDTWNLNYLRKRSNLIESEPVQKPREFIFRCPELSQVCLQLPNPERWVVERSQRLLNKFYMKRCVQIKSYICFSSWFVAIAVALLSLIVMFLSKFAFGRSLLLRYPRLFSVGYVSREGPSEEHMKQSYFNTFIKATGWPAKTLLLRHPPSKTMMFKVSGLNPGYGSTCVALLASALTILREKNKLPTSGGALTPAAAFEKTSLLDQLQKHKNGMKFEIVPESQFESS